MGRRISCLICWVRNLAVLWAGAICQFTIGLIGMFYLCIFIKPYMFGVVGFRFMYFYFFLLFWWYLLNVSCIVWFIFWNLSVESRMDNSNSPLLVKSVIFWLYSSSCIMIREFPLSAFVMMCDCILLLVLWLGSSLYLLLLWWICCHVFSFLYSWLNVFRSYLFFLNKLVFVSLFVFVN
jgi:hypothetical protein